MLQGISIHAFLAANLLWKQRKEAVQSAFLRALHFIQTLTKGHQSTLIWRWICPLLRPRLSFKHWPSACGVDFKKVLNFNIKNHSIPRHDCGIDNHYQTGRMLLFFCLILQIWHSKSVPQQPLIMKCCGRGWRTPAGSNDSSEMYL